MRINGFNVIAILFLIVSYLFKIDDRIYYFGKNSIESSAISRILLIIAIICIIVAFVDFILKLFIYKKRIEN